MKPWNIVFILGFIAYVIIRGIFEEKSKGTEKVESRMQNKDRFLIMLMAVGGLILPVIYIFTSWLGFADYQAPAFVPWLGLVVMVGALCLFWRSHSDLGKNWSRTLEIHKGHTLTTGGIYRYIRHPMYAAIWLFSLSQGLLLQNLVAGWSALAAFAIMYFVRLPQEERMMCDVFGQSYIDYSKRTGRIFPRIRAGKSSSP